MQWIREQYYEYRQDVGDKQIALQYREDPNLFYFIPYSVRGDEAWQEKMKKKLPDFSVFKSGRLITLTSDPANFSSFWEMCQDLKKQWHRLHNALKKKYGKFEYVCVTEWTKSGLPHLHILCDLAKKTDLEWLREEWADMGRQVKVDVVRNLKVAKYVTKYIAKGDNNPNFWPLFWVTGLRFIAISKGLRKKSIPTAKVHPWRLLGSMSNFGLTGMYYFNDLEVESIMGYIHRFVKDDEGG